MTKKADKPTEKKTAGWWSRLLRNDSTELFMELLFWAVIILYYNLISFLVSLKDTSLVYIGFFLGLTWIVLIVRKIKSYNKPTKTNKQ